VIASTAFRRALCALALALPGAGASAASDRAVLVDLTTVDRAGLAALQRAPGVAWWIEAGEVLLLAGDVATIRAVLPAGQVLADLGTVDPDQLALHARGCGDTSDRVAPGALLIPGASYDLVRRPRAFSPVPATAPAAIAAHLGAPEWQPVARNSTIARLHRLDRPDGAPPADPGIVPIADRVDGQRWFDTVSTLADFDRSSYSVELVPARQWIAGQFAGLGLAVSEPVFNFPLGGAPLPLANVIGRIEGSEFPDQWLVIGGHYDSRNGVNNSANAANTPGADDNASGCSGVIEAARAIVPFKPRRSIVFMCYAGEEQGLHGSIGHVNALLGAGDLARVRAMLNMDMIGWSADAGLGVNVATLLTVGNPVDNQALVELVADAGLTYAPALNPDFIVRSGNTCCSDHMPYLNAGRPGVMSIHRGSAAAYPHYHRDTDTPANLGPFAQAIGSAIVRMNVAALARLSGASDRIFADDHQGAVPVPPLPL
jgi:hypothetical protein